MPGEISPGLCFWARPSARAQEGQCPERNLRAFVFGLGLRLEPAQREALDRFMQDAALEPAA